MPPSASSLTFEKTGSDMPYPARRSSPFTLNGLIRSGDSKQASVRSVSGATQLEERLVEDLVLNGVVLSNVDQIADFIRAKYSGLRVSRYLANFERVKGGIVL
jgi:hypothetical protein